MLVKTASDGSSLGLADGTSESGSDQKLEDGIVFAAADTLADSRTTMEQSQNGQVGAVGGWSAPILFYLMELLPLQKSGFKTQMVDFEPSNCED